MNNKLPDFLAKNFSGPLIFNYIWWVLKQAKERGIKTLYFLARDGYLLREIAQSFCDYFGFSIECRYLYCSRAALRMPSYHLTCEEKYDLLLCSGYLFSVSSVLQRAELNEEQQKLVCAECGIDFNARDRLLSRREFDELCQKLRNSKSFENFVDTKSKENYQAAIAYLQQEGLFKQETVAIVDSGWSGSMQRSLRQLLESADFSGKLLGFYFGMYVEPKEKQDGEYCTWFFNRHTSSKYKIPFNNNLFECLLAAPHGMTVRYSFDGEKALPCFLSDPDESAKKQIVEHIALVCAYTGERVRKIEFNNFAENTIRKESLKLVKRYMVHPEREEALYYGNLAFCDDITEAYLLRLVSPETISQLKHYSMAARLWRRFISRKSIKTAELFWPYGTIAFAPRWKQWWYRMNVYIWEWLRYEHM